MSIPPTVAKKSTDSSVPRSRQIEDRLGADSWHIDAILPPDNSDMVYEDLQPVATAIQGKYYTRYYCVVATLTTMTLLLLYCYFVLHDFPL